MRRVFQSSETHWSSDQTLHWAQLQHVWLVWPCYSRVSRAFGRLCASPSHHDLRALWYEDHAVGQQDSRGLCMEWPQHTYEKTKVTVQSGLTNLQRQCIPICSLSVKTQLKVTQNDSPNQYAVRVQLEQPEQPDQDLYQVQAITNCQHQSYDWTYILLWHTAHSWVGMRPG